MTEDQIKAKLTTIAKEQSKTFNDLLKPLAFERLLARVSVSPHRSKLIFKGGLCLKQYIEGGRETINLEDLFQFTLVSCDKLEVENKKYPGYRINIQVNIGKTKDRLQVDLGLGDVVDEYEIDVDVLQYKGAPLVSQGGVSVLAYPPEYIFSEKLQAIIDLGGFNSRMKDYFDCYILITQDVLDFKKVKTALDKTFKNRKTELVIIEDASPEIIEIWKGFCKKVPSSPKDINGVINLINKFLKDNGFIKE